MPRRHKPKYRGDREPDPAFWNRLSEEEQIRAIIQHHRVRSIRVPDLRLHALAHLLVEQQLASRKAPAANAALSRLLEDGLSRHEAVHAIGWVLTATLNEASAGELEGDFGAMYEERLGQLTAESWFAAFEDEVDGPCEG